MNPSIISPPNADLRCKIEGATKANLAPLKDAVIAPSVKWEILSNGLFFRLDFVSRIAGRTRPIMLEAARASV